MRDGIRTAVANTARTLREASHPTVLALICAGALAPLAAIGAGPLAAALTGVLGGVGSGALTGVVVGVTDRLRSNRSDGADPDRSEIESALAEHLDELLDADSDDAAEIRTALATLFDELKAAQVSIAAAVETGDAELQERLLAEFGALSGRFAEFDALLTDIGAAVVDLLRSAYRQETRQRSGQALSRRQSTQLQLIQGQLRAIRSALRADGAAPGTPPADWGDEPPYRGLWPFREHEAAVFHGRERLTAELVDRAAASLAGPGIVMVTGASGSGKSSLIQAGLLPAVTGGALPAADSEQWPRILMTPGSTPLDELAAHLANLTGGDPAGLRRTLLDHPEQAGLLARQCALTMDDDARLLLVVDQFEELFTLTDAAERQSFITALLSMADGASRAGALVVIGMRSDFTDRCAAHPELVPVLQEQQFIVGPMTATELRQALTAPAAAAGLSLDPGLADDLLADLRDPATGSGFGVAALPLLSQTMLQLWRFRDGDRLTRRAYTEQVGGVAKSVQTSAEKVFADLGERRRQTAQAMFRMLVKVTGPGELARVPADRDRCERLDDGAAVLEAFTAERLLVVTADGETPRVEIAHDALLGHWERLRRWLEDDFASLALLGQLADDAAEWDREGRDPSFLYRGTRLQAVEQAHAEVWRPDPDRFPPPGPPAPAFLEQSRTAERGRRRGRRIVAGGLVGLLVVAVVAAAAAYLAQQSAADQRDLAVSRELADASLEAGATDGDLARLLAATAWELSPTAEAETALRASVGNPLAGTLDFTGADAGALAFSPDGHLLAAVDRDGVITLWDTADWTVSGTIRPSSFWTMDMSGEGAIMDFDRDSRTLAVLFDDAVRLWGLETPEQAPTEIAFDGLPPEHLALSADGGLVAVATHDTVSVFAADTGEEVRSFTEDKSITAVGFNLSGSAVIVGFDGLDAEASVHSVGIEDGHEMFGGGLPSPNAFGYSPDGVFAGATHPQGAVVYPVGVERPDTKVFVGLDGLLTFMPDGNTLMGSAGARAIGLWDMDSRMQTGALTLPPCPDLHCPVDIAPDGSAIAMALGSQVLLVDPDEMTDVAPVFNAWQATGQDGFTAGVVLPEDGGFITGNPAGVQYWPMGEERDVLLDDPRAKTITQTPSGLMALSGDGSTLASAAEWETGVSVIDVETMTEIAALEAPRPVDALAFDGSGTRLAVALSEQGGSTEYAEVELWSTADWTGEPVRTVRTELRSVSSIAFSPDGSEMLLGGDGGLQAFSTDTWSSTSFHDLGYVPAIRMDASGAFALVQTYARIWRWDLGSDELAVLVEHHGAYTPQGFALSPDGRYFADTGHGGDFGEVVTVWDAKRGQLLHSMAGFNAGDHLHFAADGRSLTGFGAQLHTWDLSFLDDPYTAVCDRIDREITEEEWAAHAPGLDDAPPACS
ncbi:hypothetical protein LO763_04135 [Glycomyces sp. A-F 0318]|uniref:nSTAND1 domain-containing NTPase n=1 Tax=Glycomyces amatae TaxID=2881355 RepID=UPI001E55F796|nr:AAA family ATPase [Glycomyces amatae]MCD0442812.1 hypothetical protein [Glycomyces amatae]